ncbi:N-acylneuraminate-9-phosphatase [Selaginella moellendorffii]|uniref:N-acylneuraminate-9-phosphatase n=1 Tax=Selaginella moellendorffii TaxID=88036 RepID=UPI000D1CC502|nr:N-acylneuraminate-9-phosphatase [Selaginella moellendorffii]|eukprot:XP_002981340.2 N-acylneuraminate-9-phosphatase [Selaginella moellendorffii]
MARLGAVFFDLDDTLVLTHAATKIANDAVKAVLANRAPSSNADEVVSAFLEGFSSSPWDPVGQVDVTEWRARIWHVALQKWSVQDIELARDLQACFDRERMLAFQWAEGVEALVRELQNQGLKVGLITNGHTVVQRAKLEACKAQELFNVILVGGEEPREKPYKEIFLKACELAGCDPRESVMVGDNLSTDIQGGLNAGFLATIWVNLHGHPPSSSIHPSYTISSIAELPCVLKEIQRKYTN